MGNNKKWEIDRRTFIKAGGMTLALPFLEAMLPSIAAAAGEGDPKRYVVLYIPSGTYLRQNDGAFWFPSGASAPLNAGNLPAVFQPFSANANDFSVIRGIRNEAKNRCQGNTQGDHSRSVATFLTCSPYSNSDSGSCTIPGSSFDNEIAAAKNLKAFALSAGGYDGYKPDNTPFDYGRTVSYANGRQSECWLNPYKLFTQSGLFMGVPSTPTSGDPQPAATPVPMPVGQRPTLMRNKSILDNAYESIKSLRNRVGKNDQLRLDDYFTGVRELERTLASMDPGGTGGGSGGGGSTGGGGTGSSCSTAGVNISSNLNNEDHTSNQMDFADRLKAFCDIMILAFKCNRAQVFSLMTEYENTNRRFLNLIPQNLRYGQCDVNQRGSHIEMCHWADGGDGEVAMRRDSCVTRDRFYMSQVIYMVNALKQATDPSGSPIIDNTIIHISHGLYDGNHAVSYDPATTGLGMAIAGGRNMINPGNYYNHNGSDLKDLYFSIQQAMGIGLGNFRGSSKKLQL